MENKFHNLNSVQAFPGVEKGVLTIFEIGSSEIVSFANKYILKQLLKQIKRIENSKNDGMCYS